MNISEWKKLSYSLTKDDMKSIIGGALSCACGNGSGFSYAGDSGTELMGLIDDVCGSSNALCQSIEM